MRRFRIVTFAVIASSGILAHAAWQTGNCLCKATNIALQLVAGTESLTKDMASGMYQYTRDKKITWDCDNPNCEASACVICQFTVLEKSATGGPPWQAAAIASTQVLASQCSTGNSETWTTTADLVSPNYFYKLTYILEKPGPNGCDGDLNSGTPVAEDAEIVVTGP